MTRFRIDGEVSIWGEGDEGPIISLKIEKSSMEGLPISKEEVMALIDWCVNKEEVTQPLHPQAIGNLEGE